MYVPIKVGDKVFQSDKPQYVGKVVQIGPAPKPHEDDGDVAYVKWHKGYATWVKLHNLSHAPNP